MITKKILIFGATGQIGRYCIRRLVKNNYKVIAATRNSHKAIFLKTQASIGYLEIEQANIFDEKKISDLISKVDICINLVGILFEKNKKNTFKKIHSDFPEILSRICKKNNVDLIHISALALNDAKDSKYAQSKIIGEKKIRENLLEATIIKPSIVHSVDDNFSTKLLSLLRLLPFFPLYYNGETKYSPIHASDVAELIFFVISKKIHSKDIEAIGPEVLSFKKMIQILLKSIKKKIFATVTFAFGKNSSFFFSITPKSFINN